MKEGDSEQQGVPNGLSELQKSWTGKADLKEGLVYFGALFVETREFKKNMPIKPPQRLSKQVIYCALTTVKGRVDGY